MPIDPTNNRINRVSTGPSTEAPQNTRRTDTARPESSASNAGSTRLSRLDTSDSSHDIDAARVAEIRQGIADGTLTFDTGRIADGIIASARELTGNGQG
ncbi:flagellar biosynthesis anti-sigma factor FlgM [Salinisphaera hydrothermalis]|uniref:Negative regulator of flagellin synthesis n=1 Tax=Salinisphaera hydrothermalis (strain C41B8) TaxID=1304275 RepID=A0A084IMV3_SALHC|nr:flagellar biosynthesis anti-sigma factor FlgM [Salinisphaera hydrothermalis]KEZ78037.1 anti-sigma-28 factor FlgM [Salinisphaera hydrothermalis C41B8]